MIARSLYKTTKDMAASIPAALALAAAALSGCSTVGTSGPPFKPLELHIAHINDHHSQLEAIPDTELMLDGVKTRVEMGGFARLTAMFHQFEATQKPLLKIHAGDAMTGTLYHTFFKGAADARLMDTVCFDAFELGNHEFDESDAGLKAFLDEMAKGRCGTPVLGANVKPQVGTPLAPNRVDDYIKPYVVKTIDGVRVALIGIDIKGKTQNSSRPLVTTVFDDEIPAAQRVIDELKPQGIRHFVLITHQGYDNDKILAARLSDVDVVVGGDSHSLLGDFTAQGLAASGPYPTVAKNRDGDTVCIVQAWEYSKAIGLLDVRFDEQGRVRSCGGQASVLIGDNYKRADAAGKWVDLNPADRAALTARLAAVPSVRVVAPDPGALAALSGYTAQVAAQKARRVGSAPESLCLVRVPGESTNRSGGVAGCEQANTLARGSDAAQAVSAAFLAASTRADFALQNGGGVRTPLTAGEVTMNTAFTVLPFSNTLVEMDLTGAEVVKALEDAVSNHLDAKQSDGSHPYAAGLRWDLDMSQPRGSRFSNVQVRNRRTGQWEPLVATQRYVAVTNDFIAAGRDGYAALGAVYKEGRYVNTYLLYTQTFVDWLAKAGTVTRPPRAEYAHQKVITAGGQALP